MLRKLLSTLIRFDHQGQTHSRRRTGPRIHTLERLESRTLLAITSDVTSGVLTVTSDADDPIAIATTASGAVSINGGDPDTGMEFSASINAIQVNGGPGDNNIDLSGVLTADFSSLTSVNVDAGAGNDTVRGSQFGDNLQGGDGDDVLIGGRGPDQMFGGPDNDRLVWNNGDGSDLMEGGDGNDTVEVNGAAAGDNFLVEANGSRVRFARLNLGLFTLDIDDAEAMEVNSGDGADLVVVNNLSGTDLANVTLAGGRGDDRFVLGDGATLGSGVIDGGEDSDTLDYSPYTTSVAVDLQTELLFTTLLDAAQEPMSTSAATGTGTFSLNADGTQLAFTVTYQGLGGPLGAHFHNAPLGVNGPIVRGLTTAELGGSMAPSGTLSGVWRSTDPSGSPTPTSRPLTPALVDALKAGNIYFNIHTDLFPSGEIRSQLTPSLTVGVATGTAGIRSIENIVGGAAADVLSGRDEKDQIIGGPGDDEIRARGGDDLLIWNPGDGSDLIEGGPGTDTLQVNAGDLADTLGLAPGTGGQAGRLQLTGSLLGSLVGSAPSVLFRLDIGTTEVIEIDAGGGNDRVIVGNLESVADVTTIHVQGGDGDDTFDLVPSTSRSLTVDGGLPLPPADPGDTLNFDAQGRVVSSTDSTITAVGFLPVTHTGIETVVIQNEADLDANQRFVSRLYLDLLDRAVEPDGLAFWTGLLNQGVSRFQVAQRITNTLEFARGAVQDIYFDLLGRQGDTSGVNFFAQLLAAGGSVDQVRATIIGSNEYFQTQAGGDTDRFLEELYLDVLDRGIDASGRSFFSGLLAGGTSPSAVALAVLRSLEADRQTVRLIYQELLERNPDTNGLNFFSNALQLGVREDILIANIAGSTEYFNKP